MVRLPQLGSRPELLRGAVEALLDSVVGAGAVPAGVVRAAVREDAVVQHQLRLRNLGGARVHETHVHADDRAVHGRRLDDVLVPERLIAADGEGPDPEHVRLEVRIRVMTGRRRRDVRRRKRLSGRAGALTAAGGHEQSDAADAHERSNDR